MKTAVIVNQKKKNAFTWAHMIEDFFRERGLACTLITDENYGQAELLGHDYIISLGGDGTILQTARILHGLEIPILGINVGHLGYLTQISEQAEIVPALKLLCEGSVMVEKRRMLSASVCRGGETLCSGLALNELVVTRRCGMKVLRCKVYADGLSLNEYVADGLIVSTPTGSTAYNLSAGGPIIAPDAPVFSLMPICAHALNGRGIILEDSRQLELCVESENQGLVLDGEEIMALEPGDCVSVSRAAACTRLVRLHEESFLKTLKEKMKTV